MDKVTCVQCLMYLSTLSCLSLEREAREAGSEDSWLPCRESTWPGRGEISEENGKGTKLDLGVSSQIAAVGK